MKINVEGKVSNTTLAASKPLLPLYEAIVNSIQAIDDAGVSDGHITIDVRRESQQVLKGEDPSIRSVSGFDITDNGVGFNDENFISFNTSDTKFKAKRGGKGVGRFVWLVAFQEVEVESVYQANNGFRKRTFRFVPTGEGVKDEVDEPTDISKPCTTVRLIGLRERYAAHCPKRPETIAGHIAEHCLEFFIRGNCPQIKLNDAATDTADLSLNRSFDKGMIEKSETTQIKVKNTDFYVTHIRLYASHDKEHQTHFCANERVVQSRKLIGRLPNLTARLKDDTGKQFVYAAYVDSQVLNTTVSAERTTFAIDESAADLIPSDIGWADITQAVDEQSKKFLSPYTDPIREEKRRRINEFVVNQAPMYRSILPYIEDRIDRIDPNVDDDTLDIELYSAYHALDVSTKQQGVTLLKEEGETADTFDDFTERLEAYFTKVTDLKAADLARYVCQRKAVLDFLQKLLATKADGKHHLEKHVHNVIFPMGKTSDEVPFESHNLWLIDEKLAYHAFLASDKTLKSVALLDGKSTKEPDILVFDHACAFVPSSEPPFPAITLVEFKRPMRDDYNETDNPFVQVRKYVELIRANKARTPDGREIPIPDSLPFYCYIVCDLGTTLETWARDFELEKTPDGQGFFGFKRAYNAFFEVISYSKMVSDAQKRNAIFFEKLNLPSRVSVATAAATTQEQ